MKHVIVPGYKGSPKGHWQYWLQETLPNAITVQQKSWDFPQMDQWVEQLNDTINAIDEPIQIIGHSMGAITIAFWSKKYGNSGKIISAILVAPADSEDPFLPTDIIGFSPIPRSVLPFPSIVIGSHTDPYMSLPRAVQFANYWNSEFIDAGDAGHINIDSGFDVWPELLTILDRNTKISEETFAA